MTLFHETQTGSNCRIHAINNCFGHNVISVREFQAYQHAYKLSIRDVLCEDERKTTNEDQYANAPTWDRTSLLSYILRHKFGMECFTIGMFELPRFRKQGIITTLTQCIDRQVPGFFVCNAQHVWAIRRHINDTWLCVDSMQPIRVTTLEEWANDPRLTLVFPWTLRRCRIGVREMQGIVHWHFRELSINGIRSLIIADFTSGKAPENFGDMQNWFALFFRYLGATTTTNQAQIDTFRSYETGKRNDMVNSLHYLPDLITFIIRYK